MISDTSRPRTVTRNLVYAMRQVTTIAPTENDFKFVTTRGDI